MGRDYRLDEIDKRILYHLAADARNTSAASIAEEVDVTPPTIRNRIQQLEADGIVQGYHADIDYERANGRSTIQVTCTAPVTDRQRLAQAALQIQGVTGVRELLAGRENLLVTAVGTDSDDVSRISRELSDCGLDVEAIDDVHDQTTRPYSAFSPEDSGSELSVTDFQSLSGGAEVAEVTVSEQAEIAGQTIEEASQTGLLEGLLVVSVERGDDVLTPKGDTTIQPGDVVTIFGRETIPPQTVRAFGSNAGSQSTSS